jgi:hypothetical protein
VLLRPLLASSAVLAELEIGIETVIVQGETCADRNGALETGMRACTAEAESYMRECADIATQDFYFGFRSTGLSYGPKFRAVRCQLAHALMSLAALRVDDAADQNESRCATSAPLMDGSFQSLAVLPSPSIDPEPAQAPSLPFRIRRVQLSLVRAANAFGHA